MYAINAKNIGMCNLINRFSLTNNYSFVSTFFLAALIFILIHYIIAFRLIGTIVLGLSDNMSRACNKRNDDPAHTRDKRI